MMKRDECLRELARHLTDEIVVATYSTATDWIVINDRPLNYFSFGAMGLASSHGLGFALGFPDRRVIVLDGDGSLLMNLGTLVTIAGAAPRNLVHFVSCNGTYEANGALPLPNDGVSFTGLARSAGYPKCYDFGDLTAFARDVPRLLTEDGPVFAALRVEPGAPSPYSYNEQYKPERRAEFRAALSAPHSSSAGTRNEGVLPNR